MKKKIVAFCTAMFVFAGSSMTALAAVCPHPNAPEGVHHFNSCKSVDGGRIEDLGTHTYLYGYDKNNKPIYRDDCRKTQAYKYCIYVCYYCGLENQNGAHEHPQGIRHSISHN